MQNEPKFRKSQMNVNKVLTMDYDKMDTWSSGKNEPKTNPKRTQTNPIYPVVASGEAGTNPTCHGVAAGEAGSNPILPAISVAGQSQKNAAAYDD
jgi:hypothetical protein